MSVDKLIKKIIFIIITLNFFVVALAQTYYINSKSQVSTEKSNTQSLARNFIINAGEGTVTSNHTGLIWKICSEGQTYNNINNTCNGTATSYTSTQALAIVDANGFRLPTAKELVTIVDYSKFSPAISDTFPSTPAGFFWTSSRLPNNLPFLHIRYAISFQSGIVLQYTSPTLSLFVRLVK